MNSLQEETFPMGEVRQVEAELPFKINFSR